MRRQRMTGLDFIVQPRIGPAMSVATDRHLMRVVARRSRTRNAVMRVYGFPGEVVCLGRYHVAPRPAANAPVQITRRHSGGRVLPMGDGFVGLSLILPHRSALFSDDPCALAPYQVLNRYVRGILESCRIVGVAASYPGRDFVTVDRRVLAAVSFETDDQGTLLFEALINNTRDFSGLPRLLEAADPEGMMKVQLLGENGSTSLARELGAELSVEEVAELLRRGFTEQFALDLVPHEISPLERQVIEAVASRECAPEHWLFERRRRPDLDRQASVWVQLGVLEIRLALQQEQFIKEIAFSGDFIANSPGIAGLERELRLCPIDGRSIEAVTGQIFSQPENFILGIGKLRTIADTILRAIPP
ncbi:MAG: hypothetical protein A3J75_02495 [Acidobacteria bacterium RBG_16_68_9]|nr:MAG: hypothetical protein A3J75_02495 [Acidobacteria bacterium RBG_16_68_9]